MNVSETSRNLIILSILLSFLLHTTLYLSFDRLPDFSKKSAQVEPIEFEVISQNERKKRTRRNFIKDFDLKQQMETTKKRADFLSRKTRRVLRQTVATESGITKNRVKKNQRKSQANQKVAKTKTPKQAKVDKALKGLFPSYARQNLRSRKDYSTLPGVNLTAQSVSTISTHIPNVDKASITAIDTDQGSLKYYAFYMRLHDQLYPRWSKNIEYVIRTLKAKEYNFLTLRPRTTTLEVILNSKGEYLGHIVVKSSSSKMVDFAAIDAFKRAAPFVNPPKDMIENDGNIYLPFNFRLELSGRMYAKDE